MNIPLSRNIRIRGNRRLVLISVTFRASTCGRRTCLREPNVRLRHWAPGESDGYQWAAYELSRKLHKNPKGLTTPYTTVAARISATRCFTRRFGLFLAYSFKSNILSVSKDEIFSDLAGMAPGSTSNLYDTPHTTVYPSHVLGMPSAFPSLARAWISVSSQPAVWSHNELPKTAAYDTNTYHGY